jgi:hypothetical protein
MIFEILFKSHYTLARNFSINIISEQMKYFFSNSPRVMNYLLITQVPSYSLYYTQCLTFRYLN